MLAGIITPTAATVRSARTFTSTPHAKRIQCHVGQWGAPCHHEAPRRTVALADWGEGQTHAIERSAAGVVAPLGRRPAGCLLNTNGRALPVAGVRADVVELDVAVVLEEDHFRAHRVGGIVELVATPRDHKFRSAHVAIEHPGATAGTVDDQVIPVWGDRCAVQLIRREWRVDELTVPGSLELHVAIAAHPGRRVLDPIDENREGQRYLRNAVVR